VLCCNKLSRYGRFRGSIVVVGIDILPDVSLLVVERELRILLRPVPSGSELDIRVREVRCHFEWKRASSWCDKRFEVNEVKNAEQGNVLTQ
jgi:hypothetical protein